VNTFKLLQKKTFYLNITHKNKLPSEIKYVLIDIEKERKSKSFKNYGKKQYSRTILPLIKKCNICLFAKNISKKGQYRTPAKEAVKS